MKIEFELSQEDFENTINGLNNALIAIQQVYSALQFGCEVPAQFIPFQDLSFEQIDNLTHSRLKALTNLYKIFEEIEKNNGSEANLVEASA